MSTPELQSERVKSARAALDAELKALKSRLAQAQDAMKAIDLKPWRECTPADLREFDAHLARYSVLMEALDGSYEQGYGNPFAWREARKRIAKFVEINESARKEDARRTENPGLAEFLRHVEPLRHPEDPVLRRVVCAFVDAYDEPDERLATIMEDKVLRALDDGYAVDSTTLPRFVIKRHERAKDLVCELFEIRARFVV